MHLTADPSDPATSTPGGYTFYGRYDGYTAIDYRQPLATELAARFLNGGPFSAGTSLLVWRDSKVAQGAFACPAAFGVSPSWYPLGQEGLVIFDEEEHPVVPTTLPVSPVPSSAGLVAFPAEAQRTQVGGSALPVPYSFGWLYLDLNTAVTAASGLPPFDPGAAQAYVVAVDASNGHYAVGIDAIRLDSAAAPSHFVP